MVKLYWISKPFPVHIGFASTVVHLQGGSRKVLWSVRQCLGLGWRTGRGDIVQEELELVDAYIRFVTEI